jgi:hypothetical protein
MVTAAIISVAVCAKVSCEPYSRLKKYSVGRQMSNVSRNSIGSLRADVNACCQLWDMPITRPYSAR